MAEMNLLRKLIEIEATRAGVPSPAQTRITPWDDGAWQLERIHRDTSKNIAIVWSGRGPTALAALRNSSTERVPLRNENRIIDTLQDTCRRYMERLQAVQRALQPELGDLPGEFDIEEDDEWVAVKLWHDTLQFTLGDVQALERMSLDRTSVQLRIMRERIEQALAKPWPLHSDKEK